MIIAFDLSGVFFNNGADFTIRQLNEKYGVEAEKAKFVIKKWSLARDYRKGLIPCDEFWHKAGEELGVEGNIVRDIYFNAYEPHQKTIDLINKLKIKGYKVAYISNGPEDRIGYLVKKFGFIGLFDCGIFSFEAKSLKPEPGIFIAFLDKSGFKPNEVVYIDDNAVIDMTDTTDTPINAGVILASGRGNGSSDGALLHYDTKNMWNLFNKKHNFSLGISLEY